MKRQWLEVTRKKVILGTVARATRSGSCPGMKAKARRRISNPPSAEGVTPVLMVTELPLSAVTDRPLRLASSVVATGAGNHAPTGTDSLVLIARSSAQALA